MNNGKNILLILLRHGNTFEQGQLPVQVGARTNLPLTVQGREQAHYFAQYLVSKRIQPKAIYAGTLRRQIETAQIIGEHLRLENSTQLHEAALTEIDYGPWEGMSSDELERRWPDEYKAWTTQAQWPKFFGGSQEMLLLGIKKWIDKLRRIHTPSDVVVGVTSNGIIRFFYSFLGGQWNSIIKSQRAEDLKVKTGHFCEILLSLDSVEVQSWNRDPRINYRFY